MGIVTQKVDSPLGSWTQSRWSPAHLAGLVESFWYFEGSTTFARERNFPNGMFELIVHFGERYRVVEGPWTGRCSTRTFFQHLWGSAPRKLLCRSRTSGRQPGRKPCRSR